MSTVAKTLLSWMSLKHTKVNGLLLFILDFKI